MSSRILRVADQTANAAASWRPPERAGAIRRIDGLEAERDWESRAKAAYQQGYAAGHAAGVAAGAAEASARIDPAIASLNRVVEDLASVHPRFRAEAERDTVKLAIAIARRVLHRELTTDPEAILGLVIAAFQKLNARETHRLRLSPSDADLVQRNRAKLNFPEAVEIVADGTLVAGSAIFETPRGELDASVETQLAEIDRGIADLLRRPTR
jgi:flagellar assembly protein FliH